MSNSGVCMNIMNDRHLKNGKGSITAPINFLNQDYEQLKLYCLSNKFRYIDDMFPPDRRSIGEGLLTPAFMKQVEWKRPREIIHDAGFVVDGFSRFDYNQGLLGNCWFLASIGALTFQDLILKQVVPLGQMFDGEYCGMFHFRFWRFGSWVDVVIDDKLPTINGELIFVHSKDHREFWPALLEKAYAKVCGSYADMNFGTPDEALVDFTGGVHLSIILKEPPPNLWELMFRAGNRKSLIGCGTHGDSKANTVLANGLVQSHAYTVTGMKEFMSQGKVVRLVRLFNPWGKTEWNGEWSDESALWQTVSAQDREMCLSVREDGEFWMPLEYFCKFYDVLDICCLCPGFLDGSSGGIWKKAFYQGRWVAGTTAGGCMNYSNGNNESYATNPQYRLNIRKSSDEQHDDKNCLVSLMQMPDKRKRLLVKNLYIGITVFQVTEEYSKHRGRFPASFFSASRVVVRTDSYRNAREVMLFTTLNPGEYLVVPSTANADETASFIVTIQSKSEAHLDEDCENEHHEYTEVKERKPSRSEEYDEDRMALYHKFADEHGEVDAQKLQIILNDKILHGDLKSGGFTIDACRSMVCLMDTSLTGKLNADEFMRLWRSVIVYKEIFHQTDVSKTGTLLMNELRNAVMATGKTVSNNILNLIALRYGTSGHITLESFISLILRYECMSRVFRQLSVASTMTLQEKEWMYLSIYT